MIAGHWVWRSGCLGSVSFWVFTYDDCMRLNTQTQTQTDCRHAHTHTHALIHTHTHTHTHTYRPDDKSPSMSWFQNFYSKFSPIGGLCQGLHVGLDSYIYIYIHIACVMGAIYIYIYVCVCVCRACILKN